MTYLNLAKLFNILTQNSLLRGTVYGDSKLLGFLHLFLQCMSSFKHERRVETQFMIL